MSDMEDEIDDFQLVTDKDFARYRSKARQVPWEPLNEFRDIRLLKVFSKNRSALFDEEIIECRLETWNLDAACGKYEALSYAWGEPGNGFAYIQCGNATIRIWRNLYQALLRLRDAISAGQLRRSRLIWVDALCIDQTNMQERQRQILLMKTIFSSASQVLIWLGEHDKASRQMWKTIDGVQPGSPKEVLRNVVQWNVKMHDGFIRRPWFRRAWTLQEVVLSSKATLLCGDDAIDWTLFCTIWKERYHFMKNLKPEIRESRTDHIQESLDFIGLMNCFDLCQLRSARSGDSSKTLPLSEILIRTWYRDATEAHDRVYALLGLVEIENYAGLKEPDYSLSPLELFINVTRTAMCFDKMPALLNIAGLSLEDLVSEPALSETNHLALGSVQGSSQINTNPLTYRPSWVPDWKKHGWENRWLTARLASDDSHARMQPDSGTLVSEPRPWIPVFQGNKLIVHGHIVGHLIPHSSRGSSQTSSHVHPTFTVIGLSWGSTERLRWAGRSLEEGKEYNIGRSQLPYEGETTREGDVVCVIEGIRTLFLMRMMFPFNFNVWGALEWLKEDVNYEGLQLNCLLVGPVQIDGVELKENPSLGVGHWSFTIN